MILRERFAGDVLRAAVQLNLSIVALRRRSHESLEATGQPERQNEDAARRLPEAVPAERAKDHQF